VQFPDFHLDVPPGREAFLEAHLGHFPDQAEGLRALTDLCSQIYPDTLRFPITPRLQDWLLLPIRFPSLFRHASATLGAVMDKHITPDLRQYTQPYGHISLCRPHKSRFCTGLG
jgi:hypothetical protein